MACTYLRILDNGLNNLNQKLQSIRCLSGRTIKIIAISTMVFDHFCKIVLEWMRGHVWFPMLLANQMSNAQWNQLNNFIQLYLYQVGTIAFPLFCFLISEGFIYTKNRKKYILSMLLFAIISELPFDLGFFHDLSVQAGTFPFFWPYQNVFFTLFFGLVALALIEKFKAQTEERTAKLKSAFFQIMSTAIFVIISNLIHSDYATYGILIIVVFYFCRKKPIYQISAFLLVLMLIENEAPGLFGLMACVVILLYNGKRGSFCYKYFYYWFYPLHIIFFYIITRILTLLTI